MSFFTATASINHKPHIRQKGFAPDDLYTSSNVAFHGKYPSQPLNLPSMDFGDDLAGLMAVDANGRSSPPDAYQQQQHLHQDDHYRHNIFDTQSPHHSLSLSLDGSSSHHSYTSSHHSYSHSLSIPKSHGQQQQQHNGHHDHHSGALNGNLNPMGSLVGGGYGMNGMGMKSLGGSMGMMGMANMGVNNGGLPLGPLQSPTLQSPTLSSNTVNSSLSTSLPSPPGPLLTSSPTTTTTSPTTNYQDKQSLLANEKRRRRRESHNAVERRRRDNINEKISELATLIPECMLEGGGSGMNANANRGSSSPTSGAVDGENGVVSGAVDGEGGVVKGGVDGESGVVKANKGMILRKSVDYIRYLQQLVTAQGARNRELEQELKAYRRSLDSSCSPKLNGFSTGRSEGDEENVDYDHSQQQQHHHHHSWDVGILQLAEKEDEDTKMFV